MATHAQQGLVVYKNKKSPVTSLKESSSMLVLVKKTGYYNFTLGGKQYYYDERIQTNKITNEVIALGFGGGKKAQQKKKKGKITVTKK